MDRVMSSDKDTQLDLEGLPRHITLYAAEGETPADLTYQMKVSDTVLFVDTTDAGGNDVSIVTLPSLAEAVGKMYCVIATYASNDVSVYEKETGAEYATDGDLNKAGGYVLLFCTGKEWLTLKTNC